MSQRTQPGRQKLPLTARILAAVLVCGVVWAFVRGRNEQVKTLELHATPSFWSENGYVEMVPPVRLPGRAAPELETSVWLRLPPGSHLSVVNAGNPARALLYYPEGTDAVRVETWHGSAPNGGSSSFVADARGEHFEPRASPRVFVLKPSSASDHTALRGFSWAPSDHAAQQRASDLLAQLSANDLAPEQASGAAARVRAQNACTRCHTLSRADAQRVGEFGEAARGTDGDGLFQIQTVLSDHAPIESYAPRELNLDDAAIEVRCGNGLAERARGAAGLVFRCPERAVPMGYLDVPRALAAGDTRVQGLCRARRYLRDHLDASGRSAFSDAFRACGIPN